VAEGIVNTSNPLIHCVGAERQREREERHFLSKSTAEECCLAALIPLIAQPIPHICATSAFELYVGFYVVLKQKNI